MKKAMPTKQKAWMGFCIFLGAILVATGITVTIYTSQVYQRSVVRKRDNDVVRFSSDKLYCVTQGTTEQIYYYPMSEGQTTMRFLVCNYDQTKNTLFNEKRIDYTVELTMEDGTDGFSYTVLDEHDNRTYSLSNGTPLSLTGFLKGGTKSSNAYAFTFASGDEGTVKLHVTVTPGDFTATQNRILNGVLVPIKYAATQGLSLQYDYPDSVRGTPDQFDAYNLSVSVSGGSSNVLLTWDHTKLDIDPFFAAGKASASSGKFTTLTVPMNSEDANGSYLIPFYSHTSQKPAWTDWNELPITVKLETTTP